MKSNIIINPKGALKIILSNLVKDILNFANKRMCMHNLVSEYINVLYSEQNVAGGWSHHFSFREFFFRGFHLFLKRLRG